MLLLMCAMKFRRFLALTESRAAEDSWWTTDQSIVSLKQIDDSFFLRHRIPVWSPLVHGYLVPGVSTRDFLHNESNFKPADDFQQLPRSFIQCCSTKK